MRKKSMWTAGIVLVVLFFVLIGVLFLWGPSKKQEVKRPAPTPTQETYERTTTENNKGSIRIDGKEYRLNGKLKQFLSDWDINWNASDIRKGKKEKFQVGSSKKVELTSSKYPQGVAVMVMNETGKPMENEKLTVESIIVDASLMSVKPEVDLGKKVEWYSSTKKVEKMLGKPTEKSDDSDITVYTYRLKSLSASVNFYFQNPGGLYRLMIY